MRGRLLLAIYHYGSLLMCPFGRTFLKWRRRRGKEDRARLGERLGVPGRARPEGALAWLHGASVGEGLALMPLVERLIARGFLVLVTTGTVSSARMMAARLPRGAAHQYVPIDLPNAVSRFLSNWRPDIGFIAESELWPNLIVEVNRRKIPLVLVNARMSQRSFARWQKLPGLIAALLERIDLCLAQSQADAARLLQLGAPRVQVAGNLKFDASPPPADRAVLAELSARIGARPVWVAASTHDGEEAIAAEVHLRLMARFPSLLTIVVPRHTDRGPQILAQARRAGLNAALRSTADPLTRETQIYVADTMGELGLFYRVCSVIFVGKSLSGEGSRGPNGGQNPIEPAKLGSAILHGPEIANFADVYAILEEAGGAVQVTDAISLADALTALFADASRLRRMARAASDAVETQAGAADRIMRAVEPYVVQMKMEEAGRRSGALAPAAASRKG